MEPDGIQRKLIRVRPPRVQISYELQVGDTIERERLPFALNQMNDGVVQRVEPPSSSGTRRFVDVNTGNFDQVLESMRPHPVAGGQEETASDSTTCDPASN